MAPSVRIAPTVAMAREPVKVGQYLAIGISIKLAEGEQWPYEEETSFRMTFMVDGFPYFRVYVVESPCVTLTKDGGQETAWFDAEALYPCDDAKIWMTMITPGGVPIRTDELHVTVIA